MNLVPCFVLRFFLLIGLLVFIGGEIPCFCQASEPVDFTRDIRPILSNKCFHCHGPDEAERFGELRLDTQAGAYGKGESGLTAISPGDLADSELFRRITSTDESERMPPADSGQNLTSEQIEKIRQWIEQGAKYSGHWAYIKPQRPEPPTVQQTDWPRNPIDHFILARLEKSGLQPQPAAAKELLIRRLSLDLTGLPPTREQVQTFQADATDDAYEKLVDQLLASEKYGEHWARMWLDLSRYADSAGYADDPPRTIWKFRDYVIRSLNENKPFDQFTREQLAADLLEAPTDEQLIATAFHRNTMTNNEGGTNDEEFRNAAIVDRVNTTFAVWMATTMACAQCHTHKFDPITQEEYFQVFAILNGTADADLRDESPLLQYYTPEQKETQKQWQQELASLNAMFESPTAEMLAGFEEWQTRLQQPLSQQPLIPGEVVPVSPIDVNFDESGIVTIHGAPGKGTQQVIVPATEELQNKSWRAIQLKSLPAKPQGNSNFVVTSISAVIEPQGEPAVPGRFVRIELPGEQKMLSLAEVEVFADGKNVAPAGIASQSSTDFGGPPERAIDGNTSGDYHKDQSTTHTAVSDNPWWELDLKSVQNIQQLKIWNRTDNDLHTRLTNFKVQVLDPARQVVWEQSIGAAPNPEVSLKLSSARPVPFRLAAADYHQSGFEPSFVLDTKDRNKRGWAVGGQTDEPHQLTLVAEKPFTLNAGEELKVTIECQSSHVKHVLTRYQLLLTDEERIEEWAGLPHEIAQLLSGKGAELAAAELKKLQVWYVREIAESVLAERKRFRQLEKQLASIKPETTVPVLRELPTEKQRKTHLQIRGNFLALGNEIERGLPGSFFKYESKKSELTRLELVDWLMHEDNPLTARVIANRYWEKLFGAGIVLTSEEFGSQGELPSHPELLDWLATELHHNGWDLKALTKLLVMSATYRQSSTITAKLQEADPENRLLSRGPRFRLSAEMVRDQALFVSGLLSDKMYGPPVNPPQPNMGLSAAFGGKIDWQTSIGEDRYRRGLYTTWRRSNPYPSMAAFDAPNRETCILKRDRTNTPLQAFVTLNDPVYIEAAQALGRRGYQQPGEMPEKLQFLFATCLSRQPAETEIRRLEELWLSARAAYAQQPAAALMFATDPLGPLPAGAEPAEMAAWTMVGNVLLNLDEMLMKP